ncbi:hypothetical protein GVN20_00870 [Runella sp. CRIBMP]|uniref:hypothetical protein n=1 Tax=Runella sp. CRIBMP TaxID=2683261 RepID=UPI001412AAC9|nr:hypothetical protein [Runella sp. CRIBMP]NBB17894.1 hypothetical protein [Runella sp. CRIBMP]
MKNKLNILLCASLVWLAGCTPSFYHLRPASGDIAWIDGREVTRVEQNGVVLVASYEFEDPHHLVLDVEIKNRTTAPLLVDPNDFTYFPFEEKGDTLRKKTNSPYSATYRATDPEQKIEQATLEIKRQKQRLVAASIFNGVMLVATIASDIHSSNRNDRSWQQQANNRYNHAQAYNFIIQKQIADVQLQKIRTDQLQHERANWQDMALRKTTLPVGESVRGLLFLPKDTRASYLWLNYETPADSTNLRVKFLQEKIKHEH